MLSIMIALTTANKENGCLQVLKGSHKMGRIEHTFAGEQQGADQPFVDEAMKTFERVYVELEPGDALFFHSNLLHMSEANLSDKPRWSLISCYNMSTINHSGKKITSCITPVNVVPDDILLSTSAKSLGTGTDFLSKEKEITLNVK
jgi:ectoine hydroxylase-related dioxygenase (phytanoyl-CoA dioxygenase family)